MEPINSSINFLKERIIDVHQGIIALANEEANNSRLTIFDINKIPQIANKSTGNKIHKRILVAMIFQKSSRKVSFNSEK